MVIELTGAPGSGKTTLAAELEKTSRDIVVDIKSYLVNKYRMPRNSASFNAFLLSNFYRLDDRERLILKEASRLAVKMKYSTLQKINTIRKIYRKITLYSILKQQEKTFVIDEGIWHIPLNIFVNGDTDWINRKHTKEFVRLLPKPDKLIIIEVSDFNILADRVLKRNDEKHRRIDSLPDKKVRNFLKQSLDVIETIKELFPEHKVVENNRIEQALLSILKEI